MTSVFSEVKSDPSTPTTTPLKRRKQDAEAARPSAAGECIEGGNPIGNCWGCQAKAKGQQSKGNHIAASSSFG